MKSFLSWLAKAVKALNAKAILVGILICILAVLSAGITYKPNSVYINDNGNVKLVYTSQQTQDGIITESKLQINQGDKVKFSGIKNKTASLTIERAKVTYTERKISTPIAFETITKKSNKLHKGVSTVGVEGKNGEDIVVYKDKYVNGELVESVEVQKQVIPPVNKQILVGTLAKDGVMEYSAIKANVISKIHPSSDFKLDSDGNPTNYSHKLTGKAVAYSSKNPNAGTASGLMKAMPGAVAVDPKIIPYGSKLYIKTPDNKFVYGYAVAADTGGFIHKQNAPIVDLFFSSYQETIRFGAKQIEIYVLN
jgi:3D (Asp-Asp-Asp) domain-containing protein